MDQSVRGNTLEGIKLSDLQSTQKARPSTPQISCSVLTYELDSSAMNSLSKVYRLLSTREIQYGDKTAFDANGFSVGVGMPQKGSEVARMLTDIGANRISQTRITIPPDSHEILTSTPVSPQLLLFPKSHRTLGSVRVKSGQLGWIFSGQTDPAWDSALTIQVQPAFWEEGMSDLRLLAGQTPFLYQTFNVGRFRIDMKKGQFFVLGPAGAILDQQTLNRILFSTPEQDKGRLLVVIVEKTGA